MLLSWLWACSPPASGPPPDDDDLRARLGGQIGQEGDQNPCFYDRVEIVDPQQPSGGLSASATEVAGAFPEVWGATLTFSDGTTEAAAVRFELGPLSYWTESPSPYSGTMACDFETYRATASALLVSPSVTVAVEADVLATAPDAATWSGFAWMDHTRAPGPSQFSASDVDGVVLMLSANGTPAGWEGTLQWWGLLLDQPPYDIELLGTFSED